MHGIGMRIFIFPRLSIPAVWFLRSSSKSLHLTDTWSCSSLWVVNSFVKLFKTESLASYRTQPVHCRDLRSVISRLTFDNVDTNTPCLTRTPCVKLLLWNVGPSNLLFAARSSTLTHNNWTMHTTDIETIRNIFFYFKHAQQISSNKFKLCYLAVTVILQSIFNLS